jgi:superfamily II DNA or RNA helicase
VSATGTGKTLVSIRVADELGARLVLFVVPTLDLAAQTARRRSSFPRTISSSSEWGTTRGARPARRVSKRPWHC